MRIAALFGLMLLLAACGGAGFGPQPPNDVALVEAPENTSQNTDDDVLSVAASAPEEAPAIAEPVVDFAEATAPAPAPRRGLMGLLRRAIPAPGAPTTPAQDSSPAEPDAAPPADVVLAALDSESENSATATNGFGFGLLGGDKAPRSGPDARDVPYGTVLPFGEVARVCEARRKPIGRKIESATARRYKLYDSNPGSSAPRTFYITGFKDDCPRQLTAINVLFGAASFYELLHYGPGGGHMAYGETDRAYEKVKGRVCGVRKGRPCGSKIGQLEKSTFFVNSYLHHAGSGQWAEMLIHDGDILAASLKDAN